MENPIRTLLYELFVEPPLRMVQRALDRNRATAILIVPVPQKLEKAYVNKDEEEVA